MPFGTQLMLLKFDIISYTVYLITYFSSLRARVSNFMCVYHIVAVDTPQKGVDLVAEPITSSPRST